jgi:hypothetical protein
MGEQVLALAMSDKSNLIISVPEDHFENVETEEQPQGNLFIYLVLGISLDAEIPKIDLDSILHDFQWTYGSDIADLEANLISELNALEAANVHALIQSETQASQVAILIDRSLQDLSHIEQWLLHYTNQLQKMGNDVHQIEAQNKGMQVISENEKRLLSEMQNFIESLKIPSYVLEILENEPLDTLDGIKECVKAIEKIMTVIRYKNDGK